MCCMAAPQPSLNQFRRVILTYLMFITVYYHLILTWRSRKRTKWVWLLNLIKCSVGFEQRILHFIYNALTHSATLPETWKIFFPQNSLKMGLRHYSFISGSFPSLLLFPIIYFSSSFLNTLSILWSPSSSGFSFVIS